MARSLIFSLKDLVLLRLVTVTCFAGISGVLMEESQGRGHLETLVAFLSPLTTFLLKSIQLNDFSFAEQV